tara:strand:- start:4381 stop:4563 length:183 start_codon:yes stop_codon:yes gene_type:complete
MIEIEFPDVNITAKMRRRERGEPDSHTKYYPHQSKSKYDKKPHKLKKNGHGKGNWGKLGA